MNTWVIFVIVCAAIGGLIWFLLRQKKKAKSKYVLTYSVDIPYEKLIEQPFFTPGGITVRSYIPVPDSDLELIERGVRHTITNARHYNPSWPEPNLRDIQFFLIPPHTHNVETDSGSPALIVKYLTMAGTVGTEQTAGTCIGVDGAMFMPGKGPVQDPRYPSVVLAYEEGETKEHASYFEESARNEFEHLDEWTNNREMFKSFAIVGDRHPHFEDWQ